MLVSRVVMEIAMSIAHGRSISQSDLVSKTHLELKASSSFIISL